LVVAVEQGHNQPDAKYDNACPNQDAAQQCQTLNAVQGGPRQFSSGLIEHTTPFMEI
jgi:hypothetical protein